MTIISDSEIYTNTMDIVEYFTNLTNHDQKVVGVEKIKSSIQILDNALNNHNKLSTDIFDNIVYPKTNNIIKYFKYLQNCGKQIDATRQLEWSIGMLKAIKDNV